MLRPAPLALLLAACAAGPDPTAQTAPAPLTGVDGSNDSADHACNVVLRDFERGGNGTGGYQVVNGTWIFTGSIEISAAAAAEGLVPAALYRSGPSPSWYEATATPAQQPATPGYARYDLTITDHVPGPNDPSALQIIPYLAMPQGGRLFDHNRIASDTQNYLLAAPDFAVWGDPTTCAPTGGPTHANLVFHADFTQERTGVLEPGGDVSIVYDTSRLAQCEAMNGTIPAWGVTAHVRFAPGNQQQDVSVRDAAATIAVPSDAQSVAVWFEATSVYGCHQWDSNYGANFVFAVMRAPQWVGQPTTLLSRDDSGDLCDGGVDAASGFQYDTWARERAVVTNFCFQVYQPGITDAHDPTIWQELDVELQLQAGPNSWRSIPVSFDKFVGNNARYQISWRDLDPLRAYHCPEVPVTPTSDSMYVQASLGYYVTVNGSQLRPEPGAWYEGTFIDYPNNSWRAANCTSSP